VQLRQKTDKRLYLQSLDRLCSVRWFVDLVHRFHDLTKRLNASSIPTCCYRFVMMLKIVLADGHLVDHDLFYEILEHTVDIGREYQGQAVSQLVTLVREGLGISLEAFVSYIQSLGIAPPVELLNQLHVEAELRIQQQQALLNSVSSPSSRKARGTPGVVQVESGFTILTADDLLSGIAVSGVGTGTGRSVGEATPRHFTFDAVDLDDGVNGEAETGVSEEDLRIPETTAK